MTNYPPDKVSLYGRGDVTIESDIDIDGAGDIIFKTDGTERARITAAGVGSGWAALNGGSLAALNALPASTALWPNMVGQAGLQNVISSIASQYTSLALAADPISGKTFSFLHGIGGNRFIEYELVNDTVPAQESAGLRQLRSLAEVVPLLTVLGSDASNTRNGAGWTNVAEGGVFGGQYWWAAVSSSNWTIVSPANDIRIGLHLHRDTNGGLARVSIDSDFTKANLLPTAQDVINSGAYPNTILTVNGGTCAPTDRVLDCYKSSEELDTRVCIADENALVAGSHTVVITPVGVARTVGGGSRVEIAGYGHARSSDRLTTSTAQLHRTALLNSSQGSAWEYAFQATFAGAGATFFGGVHGYEIENSLTCYIDGVQTAFSTGQVTGAVSQIQVVRVSYFVSPDDSSTLANCTTTYTLDPNGLQVDLSVVWAKALTITAAYNMCPVNGLQWGLSGEMSFADEIFYSGNMLNDPIGPLLLDTSGDVYRGNVKSGGTWMYSERFAVLHFHPVVNTWTNNWANTTSFTQLESRANTTPHVTKNYIPRIWSGGGSEAVVNGTTWTTGQGGVRYLVGKLVGGAGQDLGD